MREDAPVLLASLGWGSGQPIDLEEVFDKNPHQTISFEIAFTALVATLILSAPKTETLLDPVAEVSAVLLLVVTLIRRMAVDNPWLEFDQLMRQTARHVTYLTVIGLTFLAFSMASLIVSILPLNVYTVAAVIIALSVFGIVLAYELVYKDLLLWAAIGFYNRQLPEPNTDRFHNGLLGLSRFFLKASFNEYDPDHPVIKQIHERDLNQTPIESSRITLLVFAFVILLLLLGALILSVPLIWVVTGDVVSAVIVSISMFAATVPLLALIQFVYARYGNSTFDQITVGVSTHWALGIVYLMLLLHAEPDIIGLLSQLWR